MLKAPRQQRQKQGHKAHKTILSQNGSDRSSWSSNLRKERTMEMQKRIMRGNETPALDTEISKSMPSSMERTGTKMEQERKNEEAALEQ